MPFDGSGNFNRVMNWVNDALANIKIKADRHDSEDDNFASGLSNVITKDGQTTVTANIPWNGKRLTNVANPVNPQDAMTLAQFVASGVRYDVAQALTLAQQLQVHQNIASTVSVNVRSGTYALVASDRTKLLRITGPTTVNLPAVATVGNDFQVNLRTMGGALTLHPPAGVIIEDGAAGADYVVPDGLSGAMWCDGTQWWVSGLTVPAAPVTGNVIVRTYFGAGPHSWTKPVAPNTLKGLYCRVIAGGGAGGGCSATTAGQVMCSSGGGAGGWAEKEFTAAEIAALPATIVPVSGAGGVGVSGGTGGTGGNSSFGSVTASGGGGGIRTSNITAIGNAAGGVGGSASGGDGNYPGQQGGGAMGDATLASYAMRGAGGKGPFGDAADNYWSSNVGGTPGGGFGVGGSGTASCEAQVAKVGGAGAPGLVIVIERY